MNSHPNAPGSNRTFKLRESPSRFEFHHFEEGRLSNRTKRTKRVFFLLLLLFNLSSSRRNAAFVTSIPLNEPPSRLLPDFRFPPTRYNTDGKKGHRR
ncbi:hypothetical protein CEXT_266251 [Caerostris extrusa]|uniref:Uncharacterized protein n=1 Tax=Caerostris extrusa TaxID=172846 RepID=A0AAV4P5F3_CAEEX|nr:hypothetical protein CEXT_266251 [Caerostris extrusa]